MRAPLLSPAKDAGEEKETVAMEGGLGFGWRREARGGSRRNRGAGVGGLGGARVAFRMGSGLFVVSSTLVAGQYMHPTRDLSSRCHTKTWNLDYCLVGRKVSLPSEFPL